MRFGSSDQADGQVEDRRGMRFPGGGFGVGGLGIVGTLVVLAIRFLGGNVTTSDANGGYDNAPGQGAPNAPGEAPTRGTPLTGSCEGVNSSNDQAKFVACVESSVQSFWTKELASSRSPYVPAKLVLFTDRTPSGCGTASGATGPFYCPLDHKVYLDLGFFNELHSRFGAKGGDFAEAYVVAHEYGHHVQSLLGIERKVRAAEENDPRQRNAMSVRLELQADCFAGVWGKSAYTSGKVDTSEIAQALDAAAAVGDDRIQQEVSGRVHPESFTHGSAADRQKWFNEGMKSGDPDRCNTFEGRL